MADTITNKTDSKLGVIVKHYLKLGQAVPNVLLGGSSDPALNDLDSHSNPTLFVPLANGGLGMVASDGLSRIQGRFYYDADKWFAGVENRNLVLGPGKSCTMARSIYIVQGPGYGDYFDFINYVRRDWGSNFRAEGPYVFANPEPIISIDDEKLIECVKTNKIYSVILTNTWTDPDTGQRRSWFTNARWGQPETVYYRQLMDKAIAKLRRTVPQVKILHKFHTYLNILDDNNDRFRDSWMIDQSGKLLIYGRYRECLYPTLNNTFGQALFEMIRIIMEEHKVDGLYWDEFNGPGAGDEMLIPYSTFEKWDGYTGVVDAKTKQVIATAGKVRILSADWIKEATRRLESYNGLLMANAMPCLPEYNAIKFPRMVEAFDRAARTLEGNLYSPLCYIRGDRPSIAVIRNRLEYGGIPLRSSFGSKWPVVGMCFPLTPIELHRGWILAEERLITARSGRFAWDTQTSGTLYKFNADGKQVETKAVIIPAHGLDIVVPDDGLVILIRS